ncbi:MAG: hypothetical protein KAT17_08060 [Candidatus Aminicenantes bacterium]|nr:hypothetical protein [Candidatus Aminicenantes bacterium]
MKKFLFIFLTVLIMSYFILSQAAESNETDEIKPVFDVLSDADAIGVETLRGLKATEVRINIRELFDTVFTTEQSQRIIQDLEIMVKTGLSKWGLGIIETPKGPKDKDWVVFETNINVMQKKEVMPGGVTYSETYFYYIDVSLSQLVRLIRNLAFKSKTPAPTWNQYAMGTAGSIEELTGSIRRAVADLSSDFLTYYKHANKR